MKHMPGSDVLNVMYQHVSSHCKQHTTGNELEHLGANGVCQSFCTVFFYIPPLPYFPSLSFFFLSHATDVFLRRSNRQESTGKKKRLGLPQERGVQSPPVCVRQMQKAGPSATSSLCHMGLRDLIQQRTLFSFFFFLI